jgi:nitrate reductase gamma subunit
LGSARLRYVSLAGDYWALLLLLGVAGSGVVLRHWVRTDGSAIKDFCLSLAQLRPTPPDGIHWLFFTHLVLVSVLFAYFPFSKLVHMGGLLLSPTRNLANNSRRTRHVNPWAQPARLHPYVAYEDMFRDKMIRAGIPVDKSTAPPPDASAGTAKA